MKKSKLDVLLVNPGYVMRERNMWSKINPCFPPLGLAFIAAFLESKGVKVDILDTGAEEITVENLGEKTKSMSPSFVGITSVTPMISSALQIAQICKKALPETKVVMGGVHSSILSSLKITGLSPSVQQLIRVPFCFIHGKSPPNAR